MGGDAHTQAPVAYTNIFMHAYANLPMKGRSTSRDFAVMALLFGACSAVLTVFNIPLNWGNPNLGTVPVSIAGCFSAPVALAVGLIKGASSSLVTGRGYVEMAAGIGDGIMGVVTMYLARRHATRYAVIGGQLSRFVLTAGMVALSVALVEHHDPSMLGTVWWDILPAIALSILANTLVALAVLSAWGDRIGALFASFGNAGA